MTISLGLLAVLFVLVAAIFILWSALVIDQRRLHKRIKALEGLAPQLVEVEHEEHPSIRKLSPIVRASIDNAYRTAPLSKEQNAYETIQLFALALTFVRKGEHPDEAFKRAAVQLSTPLSQEEQEAVRRAFYWHTRRKGIDR